MIKSSQVANILLQKEAVILEPKKWFTWASGIKSPIYTDNRQLLSYPKERREIIQGMADVILKKFPDVTVIGGTATAGIPHAAWIAELLNLPMIYVRGKAKDHGRKSQIEGVLHPTDKVVMIEDLISTGNSVIAACEAVREICPVVGVCAIFNYNLPKATDAFNKAQLEAVWLTDFYTLIETATEKKFISKENAQVVSKWHEETMRQEVKTN